MELTTADIDGVCGLVRDLCGVHLDERKSYLLESRLLPIASQAGYASFPELVHQARLSRNHELRDRIVDAITTNETLFFRDGSPFQALEYKVIPELIDAKADSPSPRRFRIWSAACSTGQEPFSIAMTFCELIPNLESWDITILATDVSEAAIQKAELGWFTEFDVERGLDTQSTLTGTSVRRTTVGRSQKRFDRWSHFSP